MNPSDYLTLVAQIAVVIVGFSSIIVALQQKPFSEWPPLDQFNFRLLVQVGAITTFFSIFPLILLNVLEWDTAWRLALIIYSFVHLIDIGSFLFRFPEKLPGLTKITTAIGASIAISQLLIGIFGGIWLIELFYYVALLWQLCISFMGFSFLLYSR